MTLIMTTFFAITDWTQVGMFWATVVVAVITIVAVNVSYVQFRALHDPHVIVYVQSDPGRRQLMMIVMENIGKSVARDVEFRFKEPVRIFRNTGWQPLDAGPLVTGIPALAPGERRTFLWGAFLTLWPEIGNRTFKVTAAFGCEAIGWMSAERREVESVLELASFDGTDAVDTDGSRASAKELKRIADGIAIALDGGRDT